MKKLALVVLALAINSASAMAADMAARPYTKAPPMAADPGYDWSGFYVGTHVGYLWGRTRVVEDGILVEPGSRTDGIIGGVLAGYNLKSGPLVLGIEGDIGWTQAHGIGCVMIPLEAPNAYDLNWTSHLVGKVGYASGSWLFFATGGLAVADFDFREGDSPIRRGGIYTGYSVGGGVEYAFSRNLLGRLQYIYDDFGSKNYVSTEGEIYRVSLTSQTFRGALSWKF